jgi:DNA-binding NarL/FixJ family response regulator
VLVVDDSASTRAMLREALALDGGIEVVGEAGGAEEAVEQALELNPDVVLMDVRMPGGSGVDAARVITAERPSTKVVALTWSDEPSTVRDMLSAGAIGYVVKGGTIDELSSAIRSAYAGAPELDHRVIPAAVDDLRRLLEEERGRREQVERLARSRAEFVQVLSHELRTPLTVISGVLRMLESSGTRDEETPFLKSAIRRADELEFLAEGLELAASMHPVDREGVAMPDDAVAAAAERVGEGADECLVGAKPWHGVPQRHLTRIAFELLSNAVHHGRRPVTVTADVEDGEAVFRVIDRGGWSPTDEDFTAFSQGDMSVTRKRGGFGLGLFLTSRLCEACGGTFAVRAVDGETWAEARLPIQEP